MIHFFSASSILAFASIALCATTGTEKEFIYNQKTGVLTLDGKKICKGYSGKGDAKNQPGREKEKDVGPVPCGLYKVGPPREYKNMKYCYDLIPDGHDALGRKDFLIHGDSKDKPGTASTGCIVIDGEDIRKQIAESGVRKLRVMKD